MDELEAAQKVMSGELEPGFRFHNVNLWPLRITGTGVAFRTTGEEFCVRPPEYYMNERFLERCNGLPVIFEHPKTGTLNSDEFHDRAVGSIMLPYLKEADAEVWGIARIYDEPTDTILRKMQMSTSPCVSFAKGENKSIILDSDETWLLEGNPELLDHLAICEQGVWDKMAEPTGVATGEQSVADDTEKKPDAVEEKKPDAAEVKPDASAEMMSKLDAFMDSMTKRMENKLKEPEGDEKEAMADTQSKCDAVFMAHGKRAPAPMVGETSTNYRLRMAKLLQPFSDVWKASKLDAIHRADSAAFETAEKQIYADASAAALRPVTQPGQLIERPSISPSGHRVMEYHGDMDAWLDQFRTPRMRARFRNTEQRVN